MKDTRPAPQHPAPQSPEQGGGQSWIADAMRGLGFLRWHQLAALVLIVALIYGGSLLRAYFQGRAEQVEQFRRQQTEFYERMLKDNVRQRGRVRAMEIKVYQLTAAMDSLLTLHYQCRRNLSWCYEAVQNLRSQVQQLSAVPVEPAPLDYERSYQEE